MTDKTTIAKVIGLKEKDDVVTHRLNQRASDYDAGFNHAFQIAQEYYMDEERLAEIIKNIFSGLAMFQCRDIAKEIISQHKSWINKNER